MLGWEAWGGMWRSSCWDTCARSALTPILQHSPSPSQQQQPGRSNDPALWDTASGLPLTHPSSRLPLRRQQQRPSPWVWAVSRGISDWLWSRTIPSTSPQGRADRNSWPWVDSTGLLTRGSALPRSEVRRIFWNRLRHVALGQGDTSIIFPA